MTFYPSSIADLFPCHKINISFMPGGLGHIRVKKSQLPESFIVSSNFQNLSLQAMMSLLDRPVLPSWRHFRRQQCLPCFFFLWICETTFQDFAFFVPSEMSSMSTFRKYASTTYFNRTLYPFAF